MRTATSTRTRHGDQLADSGGLAWGTSQIPEAELRILGDVDGQGHPRARLRRGAVVDRARAARRPAGRARPVRAPARARPAADGRGRRRRSRSSTPAPRPCRCPTRRFDIVFCDHGAMTFADPYRTVPEAARLLRPGGLFAFSHHSPIETICWPLGRRARRRAARARLLRHAPHRRRGEIAFQLPYGEWIRLFRANGFASRTSSSRGRAADATSTYRSAGASWPGRAAGRPNRIWRLRRE